MSYARSSASSGCGLSAKTLNSNQRIALKDVAYTADMIDKVIVQQFVRILHMASNNLTKHHTGGRMPCLN